MIVLPVGQVCSLLRMSLESDPRFSDLYVSGEVSNFTRSSAGHMYFTLKDGSGALRCAFFRRANQRTGAMLENGARVTAYGGVSFYEPRGDLQFLVEFVHHDGVGLLHLEFERLREKLEEEGLFDPERKRDLPVIPRRIGVVTSRDGAVFHDIQQVIRRRWPLAELVLAHTLVQGDGSAEGVVDAIARLNEQPEIDVIIVARGGGSLEDLWTFNTEPVARAIFASRVPVISAIGHETDYTIADLVADLRAPTPSAAAEMAVPDRIEMALRVGGLTALLEQALLRRVQDARWDLDGTVSALRARTPDTLQRRHALDRLVGTAQNAARRALDQRFRAVGERYVALNALSPMNVLARGYALVAAADGAPITSAAQARPGDTVAVTVVDGAFSAEVLP